MDLIRRTQKMLFKRALVPLTVVSFVALISGCSHGSGVSGSYSSESGWGNYKCKAVSTGDSGRVSIGWASSESQARENALDKCHAHNTGAGGCKILNCSNEM